MFFEILFWGQIIYGVNEHLVFDNGIILTNKQYSNIQEACRGVHKV